MDSHNTKLNERTVWYDGASSFDASKIFRYLDKYNVKHVDSLTPEVMYYNQHASKEDRLTVKTSNAPLDFTWNIPKKYAEMNLVDYFCQAHAILTEGMSEDEIDAREMRLAVELRKYKQMNLEPVLRTLIWIFNELTKREIVWGVGRGSSAASYALYIIGVHDVDSFQWGLDIDDFLRE